MFFNLNETSEWSDGVLVALHFSDLLNVPPLPRYTVGVYGYTASAFSLLVLTENEEEHADKTVWSPGTETH